MIAELDKKSIDTIKAIVNRGNKAVIQRIGNGVIVMEEQRHVKYRTSPKTE